MSAKSSFMPMVIMGTLFFIFGFVTWLNGSLIPFLKIVCELNEFEALFVTFAFYISYTVMALPMAYVLDKTGYKDGMALGLGVMAIGALLFIPAAQSGEFIIFLIALFTLGTGLTILQSASNPYIVHLGPIESAATRISIMGVINKGAGVLAPLVFSALIFLDVGAFDEVTAASREVLAQKLIVPYIVMAVILIALIALIKFSSLENLLIKDEGKESEKSSIFEFPRLILGSVALFFYVGIEVIAGDTIALYAQSIGVENYSSLTSFTMSFMVLGYIVGIVFIPKYISQKAALVGSALFGILFLLGVAFSSSSSSAISEVLWGWSGIRELPDTITFIALLGLANALVWPTIWPLALNGLGKHTAKGSALLIMSIAGGALLPLLFGKIAQVSSDMQTAYLIGLISYGFILYYALVGHKISSWKSSDNA
jgi:MFS transporter, FHS family, L-fucose permease